MLIPKLGPYVFFRARDQDAALTQCVCEFVCECVGAVESEREREREREYRFRRFQSGSGIGTGRSVSGVPFGNRKSAPNTRK